MWIADEPNCTQHANTQRLLITRKLGKQNTRGGKQHWQGK